MHQHTMHAKVSWSWWKEQKKCRTGFDLLQNPARERKKERNEKKLQNKLRGTAQAFELLTVRMIIVALEVRVAECFATVRSEF